MKYKANFNKCVFCFFALTNWLILFSQDPHPLFRHYEIENGIPSSDVYSVKQDTKGYIWFATSNGVSRFNGYEFENFSINEGLPDNTVFEIVEDDFERVWFLPLSCKLSYYYKGKIYQYKYNDTLARLFKENPLKTSLCVDVKENLFLGIRNDGIYCISESGKVKHYFNETDSVNAIKILEPTLGNFVFTNTKNHQAKSIEIYSNSLKRKISTPNNINTQYDNIRIIRLKSGEIAMACTKDLYIINSKNRVKMHHFNNRIGSIYEDRDGDIWIGLLNGGVYHVINSDFENKKHYLNDISITGILQDREGGFWLTSEGYSVFYTPSKLILTFDKTSGLSADMVNCLTTDGINLFAGLENGYVQKVCSNRLLNQINTNTSAIVDNKIFAMQYNYNDKNIWTYGRTRNGFIYNNTFIQKKSPAFHQMFSESDSVLWFATSTGLTKTDYKPELSVFNHEIKMAKRITSLVRLNINTLLVGSVDGLWKYKIKEDTFEMENPGSPLLRNRIAGLGYIGTDSVLIIATKGAGLLFYKNNNISQITSEKGLCGDNVSQFFIDANTIWIPTNKGLNKITILKSHPLKYEIQSYTTADGLASNEINAVLKLNGKVYAATHKGLSFFNPKQIQRKVSKTPIYITSIAINEKDTSIQKQYVLRHYENNIKINYIGLIYKNPGKTRYRYKMLGLDTHWVYTQNREVQFTTLPTNTYTFYLSCQNAYGDWETPALQIEFDIKKAFWNTWWFYTLVLIVLVFAVVLLFKYRVNKVKAEEEKSAQLNRNLLDLKLKALRAQMNPHFTFNVMNSIQQYIINKDELLANKYLSNFSKLMRVILNNSEENHIPLAEEIKALELYLNLEAMRFEKAFVYEIMIEESIDIYKTEIPSMLLQPYVENAIIHGVLPLEKEGKIQIQISKMAGTLKCTIEDNGIGRKKSAGMQTENKHKSFGASITQQRLEIINEIYGNNLKEKTTDLVNDQDEPIGTRIEIYIPINKTNKHENNNN